MAKLLSILRTTAQPVTIDTIQAAATSLGSTIPGMQTTSVFPARCNNLFTVFGGDPYFLSVTATGNIEILKYVSGTWSVVGGPYTPAVTHTLTPLCLHVVNDQIVAIWTDEAGLGDGVTAVTSFDGSTWSALDNALAAIGSSSAGHSIVYRGAIWFATAIGLWAYAPTHRFITLTGIVGSFAEGDTVTGSVSLTTAVVTSYNSPLLRVDTVSGPGFITGDVISGPSGSGVFSSMTRFVNALPDTGNDTFLGTAGYGTANLLGSFASWDGTLYFIQPRTLFNVTRLYQLSSAWDAGQSVPAPQWTNTTFSGITDVGFTTVSPDSGSWALFTNANDDLCLFYSGTGSTKLVKTTSKTTPLAFTDVTNTCLPSYIASKIYLGVMPCVDDRRRDNLIQAIFLRDLSAGSTIITTWDGVNSLVVKGTISSQYYMLPSTRFSYEAVFTNLQPTISITGVSQPFPGRVRIDYEVRSDPSYNIDIIPEFSLDGDAFSEMTHGDGDSGIADLPATPSGDPYYFFWDTFADLDGDFDHVLVRIVARISGV